MNARWGKYRTPAEASITNATELDEKYGEVLRSLAVDNSSGYLLVVSAWQLEEQYGKLLRQTPYSDAASAYLLHQALKKKTPPVNVSYSAVRTWWSNHRTPAEASIKNAAELQAKYGDVLRSLAVDNPSAYLLVKALRERNPPIYVSDGIAKHWLNTHFPKEKHVENAGHLEQY